MASPPRHRPATAATYSVYRVASSSLITPTLGWLRLRSLKPSHITSLRQRPSPPWRSSDARHSRSIRGDGLLLTGDDVTTTVSSSSTGRPPSPSADSSAAAANSAPSAVHTGSSANESTPFAKTWSERSILQTGSKEARSALSQPPQHGADDLDGGAAAVAPSPSAPILRKTITVFLKYEKRADARSAASASGSHT